jgi:hypothetical protein
MRRASQRPFISNHRTILLYGGQVYHSNGLSLVLLGRCLRVANFGELRVCELRGILLPRRWMNKSSGGTAPKIHRGFIAAC